MNRASPSPRIAQKSIPASSLTITEVPHLRIIDDEVWRRVKLRQQATSLAQREGIDRARKPKFLFSKLTKCSVCGGGFTTAPVLHQRAS